MNKAKTIFFKRLKLKVVNEIKDFGEHLIQFPKKPRKYRLKITTLQVKLLSISLVYKLCKNI